VASERVLKNRAAHSHLSSLTDWVVCSISYASCHSRK
jgi:hypothetical protein